MEPVRRRECEGRPIRGLVQGIASLGSVRGGTSKRVLNLPGTDPISRKEFNAYAALGGAMLLRTLVLVAWLAIAFALPPMLGRASIAPDGETGSSPAPALQAVPIQE